MAANRESDRIDFYPLAGAVAVLGLAATVISVFLPLAESRTGFLSNVKENTLIQSGWPGPALLILSAMGVYEMYKAYVKRDREEASATSIAIGILILGALAYFVYGQHGLRLYTINASGAPDTSGPSEIGHPAIGLYLAIAGGLLMIVSGALTVASGPRTGGRPAADGPEREPTTPVHGFPAVEAAVQSGTKKCPDCAELVQQDARICRYCRHAFT